MPFSCTSWPQEHRRATSAAPFEPQNWWREPATTHTWHCRRNDPKNMEVPGKHVFGGVHEDPCSGGKFSLPRHNTEWDLHVCSKQNGVSPGCGMWCLGWHIFQSGWSRSFPKHFRGPGCVTSMRSRPKHPGACGCRSQMWPKHLPPRGLRRRRGFLEKG